ncbi:Oligopeptide transporter 1 [Citrus sinensis]|uniref:Oligopeptide transporter 1 n=1 Tax=Citrus sinensis TaxID=2711 RepID=A0ACB8P3Y8_CITSI|nr:Oligopeptide transporter 1 [Citrus sinensis]
MGSYDEDGVTKTKALEKHQTDIDVNGGEEVNDNPIEEVRLTVPITDDPSQPVLTFRTWILGITSCGLLAFVNQFFGYRQNQLSVGSVSAQILVLPIGKLMAATLPTKQMRVPFTKWSFSLNPGPFNLKEHVLITIFAGCGASGVYAVNIITIVKAFYNRSLHPVAAMLLVQTTQDSITAQKLGSGQHGLGIGSFGLDWSTVAGFLGSPLATPFFAIANILAGYFLFLYVLVPIAYWSNAFEAKKFPLFSSKTFDSDGQVYNITRILNDKAFDLNEIGYRNYSKLYVSVIFAYIYGLSFATLMASISHVALFEGKTIWEMWKKTATAVNDKFGDVHTRLMKKNYEAVPQWWFQAILVLTFALSLYACEGFGKQLQLPWWGLLLACGMAFFFTLPVGVIQATTNLQTGLNVITELVIGYMYPGKPLANVTFKTYGYISMSQALSFLGDFKLGHYMKVPPKSMFIVQLVGTLVASTAYFGTAWWLLTSIDHICNPSLLPEGSPWTCPGDEVFYNASIIWGVVGPLRMFTNYGNYPQMNWFFLIGFLAPFPGWLLSRKFPEKKWIKNIHMPILLGGPLNLPSAKAVNYTSWAAVGIFFNYYVFRRYKGWWARHNYILSAALDAGVAFMAIMIYFALQSNDIFGPQWWGLDSTDHCPLAKCPIAPGIKADGCPVL